MPRAFYTEQDIDDLVQRGIMTLELKDGVVLTDLAYERARIVGLRLVQEQPENPPGAPVRPYLSQLVAKPAAGDLPAAPQPAERSELHQRIRSAVFSRLGGQVDAALVDVIIARVLQSTGIK